MRKITLIAVASLFLIATAAVAFAGSSCSSAKSASAKTASASCSYSKAAMTKVSVETTRLPSGGMVVFYTSDDAETVKFLQTKAANGADDFSCGVCQKVAAAENCNVELTNFAGGVVAFITAEDSNIVDEYEAQFAALTAPEDTATN